MQKENRQSEFLHELKFEELNKRNWEKFVALFGINGACGNCWCMFYRLPKADFNEGKFLDGNKNALKELVWKNEPCGILAFYEEIPIAWCAFAPRENFLKLSKSRVHKRIDTENVWSVPCTFISKKYRNLGVSVALLKGLIQHAKSKGIKIIEAYPTIPTQEKIPDTFAWIGLYKSFERAGFKIVDQTSRNRPMVRYYVN